jgi:hypothetical protein
MASDRLLAAALLICSAFAVHPPRTGLGTARHAAVQRAAPPALCAELSNISDKSLDEAGLASEDDDGTIVRDAAEELEAREFTTDLYAHLQKRPDYEMSEMYKSLRSRVDVPDSILSDLEKVKDRDAAVPTAGQTPNEILDLVLIALREDRESTGNVTAGVETLMRFSGPGSSIHMGGQVRAHACCPAASPLWPVTVRMPPLQFILPLGIRMGGQVRGRSLLFSRPPMFCPYCSILVALFLSPRDCLAAAPLWFEPI